LEQSLTEVNHPDHILITYLVCVIHLPSHHNGVQGLDLLNSMSYQICIVGF